MIAWGAALANVLELLSRIIERQSAEVLCPVLLLDHNGMTLRHGAAPSLPESYNPAIDGLVIGPGVGFCGTAAYHGRPVIVSDVASDPLWADFRDLALRHGLRTCWSTPIFSTSGSVLGTFAPDPRDVRLIKLATHLARDRHRAEAGGGGVKQK
jgi:GAF domain-containing protein